MKKIIFLGDSITDMSHAADNQPEIYKMGYGYVYLVASELYSKYPQQYQVINRGVAGDTLYDLYARVKLYAWNDTPDYLSIFVGVNDVCSELNRNEEFDGKRFEKVYRMLIQDTLKVLPKVKILLCAPYFGDFGAPREDYAKFISAINACGLIIEKIAKEFNLPFINVQKDFDVATEKYGLDYCYTDSIHPSIPGSKIIADRWIEAFESNFLKEEN